MVYRSYIIMIQTYNWKPNELFFFDKEKNIGRRKKRQKKPTDSLPITLLRDARHSVTFAGDKILNVPKGRRDVSQIKEEADAEQSDSEQDRKINTPKKRLEVKLLDLENEEDEDTQRFLFEEAKFSAPSLLAQIEKFLILLFKQKNKQRRELEELNEEIEATYGTQWNQDLWDEGSSFIEIPDELYKSLCFDFEQFAEETVYVKRNWQTTVYRELAASSYNLVDFSSIVSSPDVAALRSPNEKFRISSDEKEKKYDTNKVMSANVSNDGKYTSPDVGKPKNKLDKFKNAPEKDKVERDKTPRSKRIEQHDNIEEDLLSFKALESNFEKNLDSHSQAIKQKDVLSVVSAGHKSETGHHDSSVYNQGQGFIPGSVINFSLTSKSCHDKGWVSVKNDVDDLEQKNVIEWIVSRVRQVLKKKKEEESKLELLNDNRPLIQRYYGDSKREATMKYKKGVAFAKFLSRKKGAASVQLFSVTLPDGSSCCFYPSGNVAVICVKSKPGSQSFYTIAYSDEPNARMLASFTPQGRGCCNHSKKVIQLLITKKEAIFHDENGAIVKKWKWAYGKMMNPEIIQLNDNMSIRCVSQSSIVLNVNIEGEVAKFPVTPFSDAPHQDPANLGYLMTKEIFSSRGAAQSHQPRKRITREEKRARAQKRDTYKNTNFGLTEETLAERLKDLEEKFPERMDVDPDAPYLLELHNIQRRVKNIVFEWMEHYRTAIGILRPSKLSLLLKKRNRINSASSLPGSMPSFPKLSNMSFNRIPSAPPVAKSSSSRIIMNAKERKRNGSLQDRPLENSITEETKLTAEESMADFTIEVPQTRKTIEHERKLLSSPHIHAKPHTSESARLKTPRPLLLPKDGCPVALHFELLGSEQMQCRCDKRRIPFIMDLEYDIFVKEQVPKTQLIVISVISSRFPRTPCDVMLDDLYYEKHKAQTLICAQSQFDPYRLLRYDLATASENRGVPLLLRRHNVSPGMYLMYAGGKLLFADYIFNGYGNAKRDLLNQILRTRKDSMVGIGLASDFRFNTRAVGRQPRTAWGSEIETPIQFNAYTEANLLESFDFNGFPTIMPNTVRSLFGSKEKDRRRNQTGMVTYNRIANMQY